MGSFISILNDTDLQLYIALSTNSTEYTLVQVASAINGFVAANTTGTSTIDLLVALQNLQALETTPGTTIVTSVAQAIGDAALASDFQGPIAPKASYSSQKLPLSLPQQAYVIAYKANSDGKTLEVHSGSFAVFSGASNNSTQTYKLSEQLTNLQTFTVTPVDAGTQTATDVQTKVKGFRTLLQQHATTQRDAKKNAAHA